VKRPASPVGEQAADSGNPGGAAQRRLRGLLLMFAWSIARFGAHARRRVQSSWRRSER